MAYRLPVNTETTIGIANFGWRSGYFIYLYRTGYAYLQGRIVLVTCPLEILYSFLISFGNTTSDLCSAVLICSSVAGGLSCLRISNINKDRHCRKRKIGNRGTLIVPFSEKNTVIYSFYNDLTVKKLIEGWFSPLKNIDVQDLTFRLKKREKI